MAVPVKDADRRAIILRKVYDERHIRGWVSFPAEVNATPEDSKTTVNICSQLHQSGLIEWKPSRRGVPEGIARITHFGIDVIEGNTQSPIAISIDRHISISDSTHIQIGEGNTQDIRIDAHKIITAINQSTATTTEKENAKSLLQNLLANPLLSKIFGIFMGSG